MHAKEISFSIDPENLALVGCARSVHEDYKIAYMSPAERAGLWNTNFHTPDLQAKKIEARSKLAKLSRTPGLKLRR